MPRPHWPQQVQPAHSSPAAVRPVPATPALPDPIDAFDVLERIGEIGVHWWSLIDHVLEVQSPAGLAKNNPSGMGARYSERPRSASHIERGFPQRENLREILRLEKGRATYCFEV
ncbi:hypothetical protein [Candidatus Skiveiella danica]|uniref:hypothetical protein n=1 Tax=Candidatus Skiveiella danica TaxID=3386177 RepID=UPI0039B8EB2B